MSQEGKILDLEARALQMRIDSIRSTAASKSGHPTTCLSAADIVSVLFFKCMNFEISSPKDNNNDRFIMSKGHGIPVVYAAYKQLGVISDEELMQLRDFDSPLEGHPTPRFEYNEAATGSLGQGLAIGAGMAINAKADKSSYNTYVLLGDGEIAEGSIWEAADFASHHKLGNLIAIVDCNRLGQTGETMASHDVESISKKFEAFGWDSIVIDGHDIKSIIDAVEKAKASSDRPTAIVAKTFKGHGVDFAENINGKHGVPFKGDDVDRAIDSLKNKYSVANERLKTLDPATRVTTSKESKSHEKISLDLVTDKKTDLFNRDSKLATRKAFGHALAALGRKSTKIYAVDADVKNSTFIQYFEDEFKDRTIQCFIAEQTMVGVATGLESRGKIPFAATFGAFFTRAHDQIRMASVGRNALRLCGSHCGVSIGEDGPSQMGLEDISMMRCIPNSIVFYPSDAVSTYKLVEHMANYHDGISYIRTTRSDTPVLYDKQEEFPVGGCKVLRQSDNDKICIVAAGITLYEALKAYDLLKSEGINISVIDAYSIKPLDSKTICDIAKKSGNKILTVEDHYLEGGLGETVAAELASSTISIDMLAVRQVSRSGTPAKLLKYAGVDMDHIVTKIKALI